MTESEFNSGAWVSASEATLPWEGRSSAPGRGHSGLISFVDLAIYLPSPPVPRDPPGGRMTESEFNSGAWVSASEATLPWQVTRPNTV